MLLTPPPQIATPTETINLLNARLEESGLLLKRLEEQCQKYKMERNDFIVLNGYLSQEIANLQLKFYQYSQEELVMIPDLRFKLDQEEMIKIIESNSIPSLTLGEPKRTV